MFAGSRFACGICEKQIWDYATSANSEVALKKGKEGPEGLSFCQIKLLIVTDIVLASAFVSNGVTVIVADPLVRA